MTVDEARNHYRTLAALSSEVDKESPLAHPLQKVADVAFAVYLNGLAQSLSDVVIAVGEDGIDLAAVMMLAQPAGHRSAGLLPAIAAAIEDSPVTAENSGEAILAQRRAEVDQIFVVAQKETQTRRN